MTANLDTILYVAYEALVVVILKEDLAGYPPLLLLV